MLWLFIFVQAFMLFYLQEMKLMVILAWTMMSLIFYLEFLDGQSPAILTPMVTPGTQEDPVIFNLLDFT